MSVQLNEPVTVVTAVTVDRQRPVGMATTAITAVIDWAKTTKSKKSKRRQREFVPSWLEKCGLGIMM